MNNRAKPKVLLVTDSTSESESIQSILTEAQAETVVVDDLSQLESAVHKGKWAFVLVDVEAFDERLDPLLEMFSSRKHRHEMRLLVLLEAGAGLPESITELPAGVYDVLSKPYDALLLKSKIHFFLEHDRQTKSALNLKFKLQCEVSQRDTLQDEIKRLQEKVRQLQSMQSLGVLVKKISHEFNNVLGFSMGYLHMARRNVEETGPTQDLLNKTEVGLKRAVDLVKEIQVFSCHSQFELKMTQMQPLVKNALEEFAFAMPKEVEVVTRITDPSLTAMADAGQVQQVLLSLCENAADAMQGREGKICIQLDRIQVDKSFVRTHPTMEVGSYVRVSVSDSGVGMDSGVMSRMFDPFFTHGKQQGNFGMGLAVAYGIIRDHEGELSAHSDPDKGSIVCIYLPECFSDEISALELKMQAEQVVSRDEHILLVDDDPYLAQLGRCMLAQLGFRVTVKENARSTLETFNEKPEKWALAIVDQTLQGVDGLRLAEELVSIRSELPVLLTTCPGDAPLVDSLPNIVTQIAKPYILDDLEKAIAQASPQSCLA